MPPHARLDCPGPAPRRPLAGAPQRRLLPGHGGAGRAGGRHDRGGRVVVGAPPPLRRRHRRHRRCPRHAGRYRPLLPRLPRRRLPLLHLRRGAGWGAGRQGPVLPGRLRRRHVRDHLARRGGQPPPRRGLPAGAVAPAGAGRGGLRRAGGPEGGARPGRCPQPREARPAVAVRAGRVVMVLKRSRTRARAKGRTRAAGPAVEIDRRALTRGALWGLAVIAPVSIGVEVLDAVDVLAKGPVVFIPALAIFGAFFLAGFQAGNAAPTSPYTHGALAG